MCDVPLSGNLGLPFDSPFLSPLSLFLSGPLALSVLIVIFLLMVLSENSETFFV